MGDSGWWVVIAFAAIVNPIVIVAGIAFGLVVRRWWQTLFALLVVPGAFWLFTTIFLRSDHFVELAPLLGTAGVVWAAAAFGAKSLWTA